MKQIIYLLIIFLIFSGATFSYLNPGEITFNYYFDSVVLAKPIFIMIAVAIGLCFGLFCAILVFIRLKRTNYKLKNKIALANKELDNLRKMPIHDRH